MLKRIINCLLERLAEYRDEQLTELLTRQYAEQRAECLAETSTERYWDGFVARVTDLALAGLPVEQHTEAQAMIINTSTKERAKRQAEMTTKLAKTLEERQTEIVDSFMVKVPKVQRYMMLIQMKLEEATRSDGEVQDLRLHAAWVVSKAPQVWSRFGFFLPRQRREKIFGNFITNHTSDLFEALNAVGSRSEQNRLIVSFTIAVIAMLVGCTGFAVERRLRDEFDSVAGRLPRE
jgi:hypothetical protein